MMPSEVWGVGVARVPKTGSRSDVVRMKCILVVEAVDGEEIVMSGLRCAVWISRKEEDLIPFQPGLPCCGRLQEGAVP